MRPGLLARFLAETLGTMLFVFIGAGAVVVQSDLVGVALAHALALAVVIWIFASVSGAHINPAVTLALALRSRLSWTAVPYYLAGQVLGGILGALLIWAVYGDAGTSGALGATRIGPGVSTWSALLAEVVGTFLLAAAVYALAVEERVPAGFAGAGIGFAVGVGILALGPASGASFNPARSLGPEVALTIADAGPEWSDIWVYLLGPAVGAALAVFALDAVTRVRAYRRF